jgi:transcriptional regulator with XRE-family HTH domain
MAKYPVWAKVSPDDFQQRIKALEAVYTQKELAQKLGISVRSLNYYQKGTQFPKSKDKYQRINALYNKEKSRIEPEAITKRQQKQKKSSDAQKYGRIKWRTAPIYPDYMYNSPASEFTGVKDWDRLEELSENGYVAGWRGRNVIPLEVQFVIHGETEQRLGKIMNVLAVTSRSNSPKLENGFTGFETAITEFKVYIRMIGIKKSDNLETRLDKVRDYVMNLKTDKGYILALLGFYFDESDYI